MKIFLLDDEARKGRKGFLSVLPAEELIVATSRDEGVETYPRLQPYDLLLLDHDLEGYYEKRAEYPNTGMSFVKWFVDAHPFDAAANNPLIICHSWNPDGAVNMLSLLRERGFRTMRIEFGTKLLKALEGECQRWIRRTSSSLLESSSLSATPSESSEAASDRR